MTRPQPRPETPNTVLLEPYDRVEAAIYRIAMAVVVLGFGFAMALEAGNALGLRERTGSQWDDSCPAVGR